MDWAQSFQLPKAGFGITTGKRVCSTTTPVPPDPRYKNVGLGKASECLSMTQSLTCVHVGLQASNGNSEPTLKRCVGWVQVYTVYGCMQHTGSRAEQQIFISTLILSAKTPWKQILTLVLLPHSLWTTVKPLLALLRTWSMSILSHVGFQLISRHMISSHYIHFPPSFHWQTVPTFTSWILAVWKTISK